MEKSQTNLTLGSLFDGSGGFPLAGILMRKALHRRTGRPCPKLGGETVFCNPPYGRELPRWIEKASAEAKRGATVVMLIPARTDTRAFHEHIYNKAEIRFLRGRVKFSGAKNGAPFPSMVVVFRRKKEGEEDELDALPDNV